MIDLFKYFSLHIRLISGDVPDSLKSMVLKLLLVIVTGLDSIDDNPLVEYFMQNLLFEPMVQRLCTSTERQQHGNSDHRIKQNTFKFIFNNAMGNIVKRVILNKLSQSINRSLLSPAGLFKLSSGVTLTELNRECK